MSKKLVIIKISGGLGNQFFQYAMGRSVAKRIGAQLALDIYFYNKFKKGTTPREYLLQNFNIKAKIVSKEDFRKANLIDIADGSVIGKIRRKIFRAKEFFKPIYLKKFIIENDFDFNSDFLKIKNNCYLSGVWQNEKYFKEFNTIIKKELTPKKKLSSISRKWVEQILASDSISIHIRRGDYVTDQKTNNIHGTCSVQYYSSAIKKIEQKIDNPEFYVFSDDINWAKNNIKTNHRLHFVSDKYIPHHEEIIIMSKCKHNIIANSSFSWWGAWLNDNPQKIVIAPQKWFMNQKDKTLDIIPKNWISI